MERSGVPDVALLIGSSGSIPTNDYLAVRLQASGCKIITVNPDESSLRVCRPDVFIQTGAKSALTEIADSLGIKYN
jgi:NAD-dependent SIR2 family protein deacetylase